MLKSIITLTAGILIGFVISYFIIDSAGKQNHLNSLGNKDNTATPLKFPLKTTLYRFEMQDGKMNKFNEWMKWHYDEYDEIITTLEREKMYSEAIFTDTVNQPNVLYWLTIDGEGGASVSTSPLKIDSVHNAYMREILRKGSRSELKTEYYLIPEFLKQSIAQHQLSEK